MKKVLVAGSKGQLGREIQLLSGEYKDIEFLFHDIDTLDLTDYLLLEEFFNNNKPCYLVNCAAYTAVDKAEKEKETAFKLNYQVNWLSYVINLILNLFISQLIMCLTA